MTRLLNDSRPVTDSRVKADLRAIVAGIVPADAPGLFNQAMMELGATVCVPNGAPRCGDCPLLHLCEGCHLGTAAGLPVKAAKKPRRIEPRTVFLLCCEGKTALHRRPPKGLLGGLWELPAAEGALDPVQARAQLAEWDIEAGQLLSLRPAKTIFWNITYLFYIIHCINFSTYKIIQYFFGI